MLLMHEDQQPLENFSAAQWYVRADDNKSHKKNKAGPCRRWGHSSEVLDNKLVVYGGTGYTTNPRHWESVYQLDLDNWDWTKLEPTNKAPPSRDSHSCVIYQKKLYIFGGSGGSDSKNDMLEYDLATNQWRTLESRGNTPSPREGHSACLFDDRYIIIYGGWNGEETFNDCYLYDIPQRNWISITKRLGTEPSPRESQSCCMLRNSMYLFGGQGNNIQREGQNLDNFCNDLHRLQIIFEGNQVIAAWEKVEIPGPKPGKRSSHAACVYQDRYLIVIGGEGYPPGFDEENKASEYRRQQPDGEDPDKEYPCFPKNDVWFFDVETNQWFELKGKNEKEFIPRFAHSCHTFRNNILVFGGLQDYHNSTNDICVLSLDGANPFGGASSFPPRNSLRDRASHEDAESEQSYGSEQIPDRRKSAPENFQPNKGIKSESFERREKSSDMTEKFEEMRAENGGRMNEDNSILNHNVLSSAKNKKPQLPEKFNAITPTHHGGHPEAKPEIHQAPFPVKTGPLVSLSFLNALSSIMSWPLASFGLLLDNALITKASEFRINHLTKVIHDQKPKSIQEEKPDVPEHKESLVYLQFEDNGLGWKHDDFVRVIMNYDMDWSEEKSQDDTAAESQENLDPNLNFDRMRKRLNEYAFNLKVAGLRLGKSVIYVSRHEDELSIGFISIDKRFNPNIHRNHVFYYSVRKSTGEYLTSNALKHKAIIFNALKGLFSEEELFMDMEKISNKIIVLELNPAVVQKAGRAQNHELVFKKSADGKPDLVVRSLDINIQSFYKNPSLSFVELSLRTYFNYFLLDPSKTHLKVFLNDSQIEFINTKERVHKLAESFVHTVVNDKDLFDGLLVNPQLLQGNNY